MQLRDDDLEDRRGRHREDGADDAEQAAADQQRDDHRDRADADLPLHDLRHEDVVLELLLHAGRRSTTSSTFFSETVDATAIAGIAARIGPTIGIISPTAEISAST